MCVCSRRGFLAAVTSVIVALTARAKAAPAEHREFIAAAFKMRDESVRTGDQAYGAVVVKEGRTIGFGRSRVVSKKDWTAHAEREAIREAQAQFGRTDLAGCLLYSSSRPCSACEAAAAQASIARMYYGSEATDAGAPRRS